MREIFTNPYVRIALGAVISTAVTPMLIAKFAPTTDMKVHNQTSIGVTAGVTAGVFVLLGMLGGKPAAAAAASPAA